MYNVHYYDWMYRWGYDPCAGSPEHWGISEKPVLVGELPPSAEHHSAGGVLYMCFRTYT